jgi:hypothetical protein
LRGLTVLSAAAVAVLAVAGCSRDLAAPAADQVATTSTAAPLVDQSSLPAPQALSDVMARLADPAVSGTDKLALVQDTVPLDAVALDRFAVALRDTATSPVTVNASEIRWSDNHRGDVVAVITVTGPNSGHGDANTDGFSFPMEFRRTGTGWQLTRETADMLLAFSPPPPP